MRIFVFIFNVKLIKTALTLIQENYGVNYKSTKKRGALPREPLLAKEKFKKLFYYFKIQLKDDRQCINTV